MEKKGLENSLKKEWRCKEGCPVTARPCKHLEALLPSPNAGQYYNNVAGKRARIIYVHDIDNITHKIDRGSQLVTRAEHKQFNALLNTLPLNNIQKLILRHRFINDLTFKAIADKLKFIGGAQRVHDVYKNAIKIIKQTLEYDDR